MRCKQVYAPKEASTEIQGVNLKAKKKSSSNALVFREADLEEFQVAHRRQDMRGIANGINKLRHTLVLNARSACLPFELNVSF